KRSSRCPGRPTQSSCASPTSTYDDAQSQELEVLWEAELAARPIPNLAPAADRRSVQQPAARLPSRPLNFSGFSVRATVGGQPGMSKARLLSCGLAGRVASQ